VIPAGRKLAVLSMQLIVPWNARFYNGNPL
jgi:hypothetical protein